MLRKYHLIIVTIATLLALVFGVYALVRRPGVPAGGDDIIIKGGSLTIECGANHNKDCLLHNSNTFVYTHKKNAKITHIQVLDNTNTSLFDQDFESGKQPTVVVTYK